MMSRSARFSLCAVAASAALGAAPPGPVTLDDDDEDIDDDGQGEELGLPDREPPSLEGRLQLVFDAGDGAAPEGAFASKDTVHLRTRLATGTAFPDGDLAFVVVDEDGRQLSTDALDCRRFRVGLGAGRITEIHTGFDADGAPCQHRWSVHSSGALMPQLAPYADAAPNAEGDMELTVLVARVDEIYEDGAFPARAIRGTFLVRARDPEAPRAEKLPASSGSRTAFMEDELGHRDSGDR